MPTMTGLRFTDKEDDVVIATDGMVKNGVGGAAYSLHTTETPGSIWSVLPGSVGAYRDLCVYG